MTKSRNKNNNKKIQRCRIASSLNSRLKNDAGLIYESQSTYSNTTVCKTWKMARKGLTYRVFKHVWNTYRSNATFFLIFNQYKYSSCRIWRRFLLHLESKCASLIWLSCFLKLSWMMAISFPWAFYETQELHYGVIKLSSLMPCEALKANYRTKNLWKLFPLHIV